VNVAIYLPLLASAMAALMAPTASRRLSPAAGLWTMVAVALVGAAATLWSLILLTLVLVDDLPVFDRVEALVPVPDAVSYAACGALAFALIRMARVSRRMRRDLAALRALATSDGLVVAETSDADAFAIPARGLRAGGTVYVTSGMLRALDLTQQRALLAHERTHLLARHNVARAIAVVAAAANPTLAPVREAIGYLCERHADEGAAAETGSRATVAKAVAAAALARIPPAQAAALGMHRLAVTDRVHALMAPRPKWRRWQMALLAAVIVLCAASALDATRDVALVAVAIHRH
jgi:Peptidase family M48